ncbi:Maf family protein [Nannocystaceae bacterium ST9]
MLASSSRYRAELLARLELAFETCAPEFDERAHDHRFAEFGPARFATLLARGKAESLRERYPNAWVLAADQLAVCEGELLHKPGSTEAAIDQLMSLSGRTHALISAVVLLDTSSGACTSAIDQQRMTMRGFDRDEARAYVERWQPLDCVGSYRIEDAGIKLFERIEGEDFTGIIGLPLLAVARLLRAADLLRA